MISLLSKVRPAPDRSPAVAADVSTGWPSKGGNVSIVATTSGELKKIEGTVVELEPSTAVSLGRMVVQDDTTGALLELPAPLTLDAKG